MSTNFVEDGKTIDYTNAGAAIAAGAPVVVNNQIGVAHDDIAATTGTGVLHMEGVWELPKVSAAVIGVGEEVIFDISLGAFDDDQMTPAAGDISGCCVAWKAAGNGDTTVWVKINVGVGTVESGG